MVRKLRSRGSIKTGNYIGPSTTETSTISYQIFSGSTTCASGGGSSVTVNHVDFATGQTINVAGSDSVLLTAGPGMPFVRSDQNGLFVGWQSPDFFSTITYLPGDGRQVCVSGFDGAGTRDYFAQFYVGIETLDMCGNPRTTFAPGETMQFRVSGGIEIEPLPLRLLSAGGSVNECTFLPVAPDFTPVQVTADPQLFTFTLPSSDADIPPGCTAGGTQHITGHWRIVAFDQSCGCNRNDVEFEVATDAPPSSCVLTCPADITVGNDPGACGAVVSYAAPTGAGTVSCDHASGSFFALGTTAVTCTSSFGSSCTFHVTVNDTQSPSITSVTAAPASLWPPNHNLVDVVVNYAASDNCGAAACVMTITSNEPQNGLGDGDASPDWQIVDAHHVRLRAERSGTGSGRIYTMTVVCGDATGNQTTRSATVTVRH